MNTTIEQRSLYDPVSAALAGEPHAPAPLPVPESGHPLPASPVEDIPVTGFAGTTVTDAAATSVTASEAVETEEDFSYQGYQVVRGEFFSHIYEPSVSFNGYKVSCNATCLKRFPATTSVQFLVNTETKKLVIRPCDESEKDSVVWCTAKRKPKQITCKIFSAKIMALMDWSMSYRYKLLGKIIRSGDERLILFDLSSCEIYKRSASGAKGGTSRAPSFPDEWKDQFGLPVEEHRKQLQVQLVDGYSVFSLTDKGHSGQEVG